MLINCLILEGRCAKRGANTGPSATKDGALVLSVPAGKVSTENGYRHPGINLVQMTQPVCRYDTIFTWLDEGRKR